MEYEKQLGYSVPTTKKPEPVFTPAQQAHQRKIFQGYAQDREAAPTREREQQRQAVPGQVQAFTRLAETGSAHAQRQRRQVAPVLQAAELRRHDDLAVQRTQDELSTVQRQVQASGKTLSAYGLAPAGPLDVIQLQREETRLTALAPVSPLPLSPVQRQALTQHASDEIGSALTRDARYLPAAGRADVAHAAVQRFARQGLDREALLGVMVQRAPDENTRESVIRLLTAQRRQETQVQEDKEERDLLLGHHRLQRRMQDAQAEHDGQQGQSLSERVQARVGAGHPLPTDVRRQLELGLNADLSRVRIHDDAGADKLAKSIGAVAFTSGQDIFFRAGKYQPNTQTGVALLLHEGTHTVQQARGLVPAGIDADAGLEQEAVANEGKTAVLPAPAAPETSASKMTSSGHSVVGQAVQRLTDHGLVTPADFWFDPSWAHQFTGTLGKSKISMTLARSGQKVTGTYQYQGHSGQLTLSGNFDVANGTAQLSEIDLASPTGEQGRAKLQLIPSARGPSLIGDWTGSGQRLEILLNLNDVAPKKDTDQAQPQTALPSGATPILPTGLGGHRLTEGYLSVLRNLADSKTLLWEIQEPAPDAKVQAWRLSEVGRDELKSYEGQGLKPYLDSSGYNTIGYGHLLDKNLDGETDQREWQTYGKTGFPRALTSAQQEELLTQDLKPYEDAISQAIQVPITQEMFDAFIIFSFNTGNPGSFAGTNVLEVLNKGLYDQLPGAMYKWIYSNKRQVKGLKNRRLKEITMFARPYQNGRKP